MLRGVVATLARLADGGGPDGQSFMTRVAQYEAGARFGARLDELLGLPPGAGRESWWARESRIRRDELLRTIALRFFPDQASRHSKAAAIARGLLNYEASSWRHDKKSAEPPRRGRRRELEFLVLKCGPAPLARTVERALTGPPCLDRPLLAASESLDTVQS